MFVSMWMTRDVLTVEPDASLLSVAQTMARRKIRRLPVTQTGSDGKIRRCHCPDPSWQNWPALEHAAIDNIVPDFPLINKSFNLSYSGQDL